MANTEIPEEVPEPPMIMPDNMYRQDVVMDPKILGDNTEALLDFLQNSNNYNRSTFIVLFLLTFEKIFQRTSETDNNRWKDIEWHVSTNGKDQITADGLDGNSFYFEFFDENGKQMLRVHYEGQIKLERITNTNV